MKHKSKQKKVARKIIKNMTVPHPSYSDPTSAFYGSSFMPGMQQAVYTKARPAKNS